VVAYHHGDLRDALLDAAETLIRERGVAGWSLREASVRVGVSPSAAYHHFSSRDALVDALSDRVLARLGERMSRAASRVRDPAQRVVALARTYVHWAVDDPAVSRLAFGANSAPSAHPHDVLSVELARLGTRPGADFVIWAAIHGLAVLLADGLMRLDGGRAVDREVERVVRAVLTGLAHEGDDEWPVPWSVHTERVRSRRV
jgi:AcrR family transcriptional regulator